MSGTTPANAPQGRFEVKMQSLIERDAELAALMPIKEVEDAISAPELSLDQMLDRLLRGYAQRPALAGRRYKMVTDEASGKTTRQYLPSFANTSYQSLRERTHAVANAWRHHPEWSVEAGQFVCILGFASVDFQVLDFACAYAKAVTVPLQSSTSGADLDEIFRNVAPAALAATVNDLVVAAEHAVVNGDIRSLIAFDYDERDDNDRAQWQAAQKVLSDAGVATQLITLEALEAYGRAFDFDFLPQSAEGDKALAAIIHSSGSTGKPKGAMLSEGAMKFNFRGRGVVYPCVRINFAPLNHLLGRNTVSSALRQGGTVYYTLAPDMSTLFEDIRLARPTHMTFFPRVLELIYQDYQNEVAKRVRAGDGDAEETAKQVRAEMSASYLGDRLVSGAVGGAPTSAEVMAFFESCFDIKLIDGYGNTESGAGTVALNGVIQRPPIVDYKLKDVPELGYYTTDKPYPRGELVYKSAVGISGYYKDPEATAKLYDEEGWSCTGDIVEERGPDHIAVIDRRKDVLKLSQGEYVAIGILGTKFEAASALIKQIFVYGNSLRSYLLAVVVPEEEIAVATLGENYSEAELKNLVRDELQQVARTADLKSFEVPRDFIIEHEPFSQENGLLSSVRKRLRPALVRKYGERLEAIYEDQAQAQEDQLKALKDPTSPLSVLDKLKVLLEVNLKIDGIDISKPKTFAELGGDSLGAVAFSLSIEEVFGVSIPADTLLGPTSSPQKWAQLIEAAESGADAQPTFASIHGKAATGIKADDLQLASFIDEQTLQQASAISEAVADERTVLLTGANGFLGHIVCLEWLEKLAPKGGKLVCLVRGQDNAAAKARLDAAFAGVDAQLEARYQQLAKDHLEVLAGDAGEPLLGLSETDFSQLAEEVDRISHVAALVNHRFSYANLFGPNVVGTAEIIRLALTARKKQIDFVSTEAVYRLLDGGSEINEDTPLLNAIELSDGYAAGYGASKWAGEHLLIKANQAFGLPINTFRGDMMLTHRQYKGQLNQADMFTRMLFSVIATGLAPYSFYQLSDEGKRACAHYDGTPVDVVAAAVAGVTDNLQGEYRNYHVNNYHLDDGCSWDTFVDSIEQAGYPVHRMVDHGEWLERFKDKLNSLPDLQRQRSVVDLLQAFSRPLPVATRQVGCDRFKALVKQLHLGPELPHISADYIRKFIDDLVCLEYIEPQVQ